MGAALTKNQRWKEMARGRASVALSLPWENLLTEWISNSICVHPTRWEQRAGGSLSSRPIKRKKKIFGPKGSRWAGEQSFFLRNLWRARSKYWSPRAKPSTRETLDTAQDNKGAFKNRRADRSRWPSVARTLVLGRIRRIVPRVGRRPNQTWKSSSRPIPKFLLTFPHASLSLPPTFSHHSTSTRAVHRLPPFPLSSTLHSRLPQPTLIVSTVT